MVRKAESETKAATKDLTRRGDTEARALEELLTKQKKSIEETLEGEEQLALEFSEAEKRQLEEDRNHMQRRLARIDEELESEPGEIREMYGLRFRRLQPVGLVYLWPETRG